jgi:hypothetical protein
MKNVDVTTLEGQAKAKEWRTNLYKTLPNDWRVKALKKMFKEEAPPYGKK